MYFGLFLNGYPLKIGTNGNTKNEDSGSAPANAFDEEINHADEHKFAIVNALKSLCDKISSLPGNIAEMETVINCKTAIKGHTKKTKLAGVTRVGNNAANSAFVVAPTVLVNTFDNVTSQPPLIGPMLIMDAMLMRPKYDNDMRAGT